jgi:hypothetical protein
MPAPIAVFAYARPDHLARTMEALRRNPEAAASVLYVFCDAAKNPAVQASVDAVRNFVRGIDGFAKVDVVLRETNFGLARNITGGVTQVLQEHPDVIVVEDDVLVAPHFLRFMNDALDVYRDEPRVGSATGYCYPVDRPLPETFFIKGADCWGWATWRDRWAVYNPNGTQLLQELQARGLESRFNLDGTMGFSSMLEAQIAGKNDSWAVRWHASCFLRDMLILYPGRSLVENIGNDGSGTHVTAKDTTYDVEMGTEPIKVGSIAIGESKVGRAAFCDFFHRLNGGVTAAQSGGRLRLPARVRGLLSRVRRWARA